MATITDIVAEQSQKGDVNLGGGTSGVLQIDLQPVQELARFTMFRNKVLFDQRQKDIDAKIGELAEFTALDLNGTRGKDRDYLLGKWDEVQKASEEYARYTPTNQRDKVEKKLEYDKKLAQLKFDINSANKRALGYGLRLNKINQSEEDAETKTAKLKDLNSLFDTTDIITPIPAEENYSIEIAEIGNPIYSTNEVTNLGANGGVTSTYKLFAPKENNLAAFGDVQGLTIEPLPANASDYEKREYEAKQRAYKKGGHTLLPDAAINYNTVINDPKYQTNGQLDFSKLNADNPVLAAVAKTAMDWNKYATVRKAQMERGEFYDKNGIKLATLYNPDDYFQLDVTNLTGQNLAFLERFKKAVPDGKQEKYFQTDNAIQQQNADTNRMKLNLDGEEFKLKEKQWNASQTGGETVKNGAMEFAKNIYGQLEKIADEKGFISPDQVRNMTNEQLKYLGITTPTTQGVMSLNALKIPKGAALVLRGNEIKVLNNAKFSKEKGYWEGKYDNTLSTTITNVATNRLNEELKNAGSKEVNTYLPLDLQDGTTVSENNTQTTQSSSGGSQSRTGKDGKVYTSTDGITWIASDGTTVTLKKK